MFRLPAGEGLDVAEVGLGALVQATRCRLKGSPGWVPAFEIP